MSKIHISQAEIYPPPFLKWAGGKKLLLPKILPHMPTRYKIYHEPFMGGAALFFASQPQQAQLSDLNYKLVSTFIGVRDNVEEIIEQLDQIPIDEETYYRIRSRAPKSLVEEAAKFIYLNKACWNGLYRENKKGEFNVPFGLRDKQKSLVVTEPEKLRRASKVLQNKIITHQDFKSAMELPKEGDFVYLDPPYTVSHNHNGFIEYNAAIFSWEDQVALAEIAKDLRIKGVKILISNADHTSIRKLYEDFDLITISRSSTIASNKKNRRKVTELLIKGF